MEDGLEEVQKPIGNFIINNAKGTPLADGQYYHYGEVIKLLRLYEKSKLLVESVSNGEVTPKTNYPLLREQLLLVAKELGDCGTAATEINKITDKASFRRAYRDTFEAVAKKFDIDLDNDDNDYDSENSSLKGQISDLEEELEKYENYGKIESINDEWAVRAFNEYRGNYTYMEIEELMQRGKEFLNQKK